MASSLCGASSTNPYTIREIKHLREFPKVLLNLSVRPSPGSFKVLYESSKWPASFVEERNAKLLSEMRENHAKCVSVKKQPPEVFYKKSVLISLYSQESYVLESLFWFKRDSNTGVYLWILKKICERLLLIVLRSDYFLSTPFALKSYDFFQRYKNSMNWSSVQLAINFLL